MLIQMVRNLYSRLLTGYVSYYNFLRIYCALLIYVYYSTNYLTKLIKARK
jgi:hypothetical protein